MGASRVVLHTVWVTLVLFMSAEHVLSQPVWTDKFSARGVTVDWLKPFHQDDAVGDGSSITFISGRFPEPRRG